nr:putative disease resistance protein RGA1 [Ziziphus jujuba var. spinosa]XP_048333504.1 putative disease resistance protein RGA1 [Ziziphus jujuba var. spinosa]XP_048333524.1 putative disease resistance protein RGA1 [Ziziphus jujuba var. spinosa]
MDLHSIITYLLHTLKTNFLLSAYLSNKPMAEIVLSAIAKEIIEWLASAAVQEVGLLRCVKHELSGLEDTISTIKAVLLDAEEKQNHNHQIKNWLKRLEDVVFDADDLMDEFNTEAALLQQRRMLGSEMTKQVCTFFSNSNQLAFQHKLGHKIKGINKRLAVIRDDRQFHLDERHEESRVVTGMREDTHSYVPEEEVIGRDKDKMAIMKFLLDENIEENLAVISIVGIGGLGKTALAQLVYNDETVQKNFDLRMWVCVSNDFNVRLLVEKILKFATDKDLKNMEMEQLRMELQKEIKVKRYLLVLDDVWNENDGLWLSLKMLLSNCAKGSRIVVTTRSARVSEIMSTSEPYILEGLDKDKSWSLFEKMAFKHGHEASNSNIVEIGKQIVKKYGGIPLAIRTIGRMLYFKNSETEWLSFLEMEFSRVPQNDILPTLKLSYDNLPSHLKQCFASCHLFPKDYEINVEMLINVWMALGFVKQSDSTKSLFDTGREYFMDLLWRSFFQEHHEDEFLNTKCKMHDLMHDLATQVGGIKCISLQPKRKTNFDKSTRHVSFNFHLDSSQQIPTTLSQAKRIRTILLLGQSSSTVQGGRDQSVCDVLVSSFMLVRILDLHNLGIKVVPNSIGKLRHLRYLDLSQNEDIKALPDSITTLYNLQTLKLSKCRQLQELPRDMKNLVNLVNLEITKCNSLTHMPSGLDQLTNLQTLTAFVLKSEGTGSSLSRHSDSAEVGQLRDLMQLNNLRGEMVIRNLGNEKDAKSANLMGKRLLHSLCLTWKRDVDYEATIKGLQPHPNLKLLYLRNYEGVRFSSWFPSLTNLVCLKIKNCRKCQYLPPLTQFHSLKQLHLTELDSLEYISEEPFMPSTTILPSLESLMMRYLPNVKGWWREEVVDENSSSINNHYISHSFPRLSELLIGDCPKMTFLPLSPNIVRMGVENNTWKPFQQAMQNIPALKEASSSGSSLIPFSNLSDLRLHGVDDLKSLPEWLKNFTSLREFAVVKCRNLKCLSPGVQHLASTLQDLCIKGCHQLDMSNAADEFTWLALNSSLCSLQLIDLPQLETLPIGLLHVKSLQQLRVIACESLTEIPEWISNFKSLHTLEFVKCYNLRSLPQGLHQLTSLQKLTIIDCPVLYERCQRERGEDWPKVAHVPELILRLTVSPKPHTSSSGCNRGILNKFRISRFCSKGMP